MSKIINYAGEDFDNEIILQTGLTLVDFYAIWCGPCQMLEKVISEVADNSECKIVKVDVDDYPEFGTKFKIRGNFVANGTILIFKQVYIKLIMKKA